MIIMRDLDKNITLVRATWLLALMLVLMVGCKPTPQQVRHHGEKKELDSLTIAQLQFNQRMASAADKQCLDFVQADSQQYVQDDFGFWYTKLLKTDLDSLHKGEYANLHIQIYKLNDSLVADIKDSFQVGNTGLPIAINRSLKMMRKGEHLQIVTPWYMAYGVEGTSLIKPYSNLKIVVSVGE